MEISAKQLRVQSGRIISQVNRGMDVIVTYRGKPSVKIVPINREAVNFTDTEDELFGIWKDRKDMENVDQYVRDARKGRKL